MSDFTISNAIGMLSGRLQFLDQRHKLIIDNLAHADTPGFKSQDLSFEGFVSAAEQDENPAAGEPGKSSPLLTPRASVVTRDGHEKLDGNNVNVETEMANMTDNSVEFMTATEIIKRHLNLIKFSITDR